MDAAFRIDPAVEADVPVILDLIRDLAEYEKLSDQVTATEADIARSLFGDPPRAEAVIARLDGEAIGFALFFHNYSTFLGRPGLYLEDLYVRPASRGRGFGRRLLIHLARIAVDRGCGRFEWSVLNWNAPAIAAYRRAGAVPLDDWTVYRLTGDALKRLADEAH
ncbi:MAG: GNAT family N-acetyltransferase [Acidobacteria bacterium]|nr:GNAT family N-acetyltransferase [Acidobacteriota bacterium]